MLPLIGGPGRVSRLVLALVIAGDVVVGMLAVPKR